MPWYLVVAVAVAVFAIVNLIGMAVADRVSPQTKLRRRRLAVGLLACALAVIGIALAPDAGAQTPDPTKPGLELDLFFWGYDKIVVAGLAALGWAFLLGGVMVAVGWFRTHGPGRRTIGGALSLLILPAAGIMMILVLASDPSLA